MQRSSAKGLVITSVTDAGSLTDSFDLRNNRNHICLPLRFVTLVFMGKESEHLVKQHPHEAPKVMLYPAMILAGLCIVWGLAEPLVMTFMHVDIGVTLLGSFISLETPIFLALLVPTGFACLPILL